MSSLGNNFFLKNKPVFKVGVVREEDLPIYNLDEYAFVGRSNVGKSSLINAITNSKIAVVSKTPGRTKQVNFFQIGEKMTIVDMPGYGYAKANKKDVENWNDLIFKYFLKRKNLKRIFLLIDSRHGLKDNDRELMKILDKSGMLYQIILTKIDEIKPDFLKEKIEDVGKIFKEHPALFVEILFVSAKQDIGIKELRETIFAISSN